MVKFICSVSRLHPSLSGTIWESGFGLESKFVAYASRIVRVSLRHLRARDFMRPGCSHNIPGYLSSSRGDSEADRDVILRQ